MKMSPIEIGKIRQSLPYLRRHMTVPAWLERAVGSAMKPPKIGKREIQRLVAALMVGPKRVELNGHRLVIGGKRGPGRPPGSGAKSRGSKGTDSRGHAVTAKRRAAMKRQGRYMGALAGLTAAQRAKVKGARAAKGYAAALALAAKLGRP